MSLFPASSFWTIIRPLLGKWGFPPEPWPSPAPPAAHPLSLAMHLTPTGWHLTGLNQPLAVEHLSWHAHLWPPDPLSGVEQAVRELILRHGPELLEKVEGIAILLDLPGMGYADDRHPFLNHGLARPEALRGLGAELLNVPEVTHGSIPLSATETAHALHAFADARVIRGLLSLFDKLGLKIRTITPLPLLLLPRALASAPPVYAGLCVGELESTVVLFHGDTGNLVVRPLAVGLLTLGQAMATGNAISLEEALQTLADPALLAGMTLQEDADIGFLELALLPPLRQLLTGIRETLDYFGLHRACLLPASIEVLGDARHLAGLVPWLQRHLAMPLTLLPASPLALYAELPHPLAGNLLTGAEHSLLTVGRTKYYYSQQGFIRHHAPVHREPLPRPAASSPAPFARLRKLFPRGQEAPASPATNPSPRPALIGGLLLALVAMGWSWGQFQVLMDKYQNNVKAYLAESNQQDQWRQAFKGQTVVEAGEGQHKRLWTEKFLAITDHLDPAIWLTDLYFEQERRSGTREEAATTYKLVIKGKVLPSREGYMKRLTIFMDRLLQDKTGFMKGFRTIQFMGAEEENDPQGPLVRFTLEAWYDKNPQSMALDEATSSPTAGLGLAEMQQNVNQRNQTLERFMEGGESRP